MKQLVWMIAALTLTVTACTKTDLMDTSSLTTKHLLEDNGCVERIIIPVKAHTVNSLDTATINMLFSSNGINNSNFRYYRYIHDTLQTLYPPYSRYDQKTVRVDQYTNGLRIFTGDLVYNFLNGGFNFKGGNLTNGTSLSTTPNLTLGQIRKLFLDNIEQFDHASNKYNDSCFKAEFGYFNLNAGTSYTQEMLVKAWKVTLKNSVSPSEYPVAFYQDGEGKLIYYDNGIRTFR